MIGSVVFGCVVLDVGLVVLVVGLVLVVFVVVLVVLVVVVVLGERVSETLGRAGGEIVSSQVLSSKMPGIHDG